MSINGASGIARQGRDEEYATELWLEGPSAFWLHPEGPLSDTTPEEWLEKQPKPDPVAQMLAGINEQYRNMGMQNSYAHSLAYMQAYQGSGQLGSLGNLLGGMVFRF